MPRTKLYLIVALIGLSQAVQSQNFEWLRSFGLKDTYHGTGSVCAESNGGCTFLIIYNTHLTKSDTMFFDSIKYIYSGNFFGNYLVQTDSAGKVKMASYIGDFSTSSICRDGEGNYYITGNIYNINNKAGPVTMDSANGGMVFAKFDKNFKFVWAKQYGDSKAFGSDLFYSEGHLYFVGGASGIAKIGDSTYNFAPNSFTDIFGELNPADGKIKWSNYFFKNIIIGSGLSLSGALRLKNKLYLSGQFYTPFAIIGKDTLAGPAAVVIETDTAGRYLKAFAMKSKLTNITNIISDGEYLYFGGGFSDTLTWGNKQIYTQFKTGVRGLRNQKRELFVASITTSFQPRWFFRPKLLDTTKLEDLNSIQRVVHSGGYIYCGGRFTSKMLINGNVLEQAGTGRATSDILLFKCDFLGNILWATSGYCPNGSMYSMAAVSNQSVFAGGHFNDKMQLGKYKENAKGSYDAWLSKISDYSITRGKVIPGPYCAGDTIKVPYTKFGSFDTSNIFIAQLSDENGDFENGYRELGRLKSNKDGVIKGQLPLFNVSSSANYRIRVLSTKPPVQSYYLRDTLRLLIYSKDKADPGPPETICYGDSIKLSTFGGTKWTWSPKYNMSGSTLRQPIVWPIKTTTYKIIIADSSGCGAPDTAYKLIKVRPPLKTVLAFNDTIVCSNDLKVPYYFTGGDSVNYSFQWYFVSNPTLWFSMKSGKKVLYDTLNYCPSEPLEKLAIVLTDDGCTNKPDTSYLIIKQRQAVVIKSRFRDTSLCSGHSLKYKAIISGGLTKSLKYQWKDLISNTVLSNTDSLKITSNKTLKIQLIVNEGCETLGDTALFNVTVKPPLKATSNLRDTSLCFGRNVNYTAKANGGDSKAYNFTWLLDGKVVSITDNFALKTEDQFLAGGETKTLIFILKDNCSLPNDTIKKTITIKPAPKANFTYDLACHRTTTNFTFTGAKPLSPVTTTFNWNLNNEASSNLENPFRLFSTTGTKKIDLTVSSSNGCLDTLTKDIDVQFQSTADFSANDVCESDSVVFINKSKDATGYRWRFGDGIISNIQDPKHKYQIASSTTFNVSLVAVVNVGCSDSVVKAVTINENPKSDFTYTQAAGGKVDFKANQASASSYRWLFGNGDSAKVTTQNYSYTYSKSSLYNVCLKVSNTAGCQSQTCKEILITLGISSLDKPNGFKIYPNPNSGNFIIEIENPAKDVTIEVFDMMGMLVKTIETNPNKKSYPIDLVLADGIFLVRVRNEGIIWNQKVVVSVGEDTNR